MSILSHIVALEVGNLEKAERITELEAENLELKNDVTMIAVKARDKRIAQLEGEKDALRNENEKLKENQWSRDVYDALEKEGLPGQRLANVIGNIIHERDSLKAHVAEVEKLGTEFVLKTANLQRDKEALEKEIRHLNNLLASENVAHKADKEALTKELATVRHFNGCFEATVKRYQDDVRALTKDKERVVRELETRVADLNRTNEDVQRLQSDKNRYANKIYALEEVINDVMNAGSKAIGKTY